MIYSCCSEQLTPTMTFLTSRRHNNHSFPAFDWFTRFTVLFTRYLTDMPSNMHALRKGHQQPVRWNVFISIQLIQSKEEVLYTTVLYLCFRPLSFRQFESVAYHRQWKPKKINQNLCLSTAKVYHLPLRFPPNVWFQAAKITLGDNAS